MPLIKSLIKEKDYYEHYKEYCNKKNIPVIDKDTYMNVSKDFAFLLSDKLIFEDIRYEFPYDLGTLYIVKKDYSYKFNDKGLDLKGRKMVDYGETNKLWSSNPDAKAKKILVPYENNHTDGSRYMFHREVPLRRNVNNIMKIIMLIMERYKFNRKLAKELKSGLNIDRALYDR